MKKKEEKKKVIGSQTQSFLKISVGKYYIDIGKKTKEFRTVKELIEGWKNL